jgi:7-cyano-7-deazaguanine reductase
MANNKLDNSQISKHLGQVSEYKSNYDPNLLVRELRSNNREYLDIYPDNLPFIGYDTWNAYECSFLLNNGLPVTGLLKIVYPCTSKYIVESKSIKLYLNSFNMEKITNDIDTGIMLFKEKVKSDLSKLLETNVTVAFHKGKDVDRVELNAESCWNINSYYNIDDIEPGEDITVYKETPELLTYVNDNLFVMTEYMYHSRLLKSNCRVTSQPDWGDVFIYLKTPVKPVAESILRYIVSFRDECHFHEEICECIYKRMLDVFIPTEIGVMCLYARRGGIDINPIRCSSEEVLNKMGKMLINPKSVHLKTSKQ